MALSSQSCSLCGYLHCSLTCRVLLFFLQFRPAVIQVFARHVQVQLVRDFNHRRGLLPKRRVKQNDGICRKSTAWSIISYSDFFFRKLCTPIAKKLIGSKYQLVIERLKTNTYISLSLFFVYLSIYLSLKRTI